MHAYLRAFWLPKEGNTESEYEDAFFPNKGEYPIGKRPRFAIADGATEASFSRLWARMLVRGFVRRSLGLQLSPAELEPFRERWKGKVHAKALPWYAEEKAACGAFAALLGLEFSHETSGNGHTRNWQATAAGDCCLVQIRQNEIITTFPYGDSVAFNNRPDLLSSLPSLNDQATEIVKTSQGSWGCEDTFFLMTDALACWFFKELETGKEPWNNLRDLETEGQVSFPQFIEHQRHSVSMRNDDVTLVQIDIA